jgi:mono/diheme cytochrome c family protein
MHPRASKWQTTSTALVLMLAALPGIAKAQSASNEPYRIECDARAAAAGDCRVDQGTYVGWRAFQQYCSQCHGPDGAGSSFAPSLVARVRGMSKQAFLVAMEKGYFGADSGLRPWGEHPYVSIYYNELWAYLSARAGNDLPPGEPELLRENSGANGRRADAR